MARGTKKAEKPLVWEAPQRASRMSSDLFALSLLPGIIVNNASLVIGWGSLNFYSSPYRVLIAILLTLEVLLARLLENADTGVRTVGRQAWVALFAPFWIAFNIALAWTLRRGGAIPFYSATLGMALFLTGLGFRVWSARTLGRFFSLHVTIFEDHRLITHGPYAISRHPSYLGSLVQIIGLGFMFHAPLVAVIGLLVFAAVLVLRVRDEEYLLGAAFSGQYVAYRRRVPLLLPGLSFAFNKNSHPETETVHDSAR